MIRNIGDYDMTMLRMMISMMMIKGKEIMKMHSDLNTKLCNFRKWYKSNLTIVFICTHLILSSHDMDKLLWIFYISVGDNIKTHVSPVRKLICKIIAKLLISNKPDNRKCASVKAFQLDIGSNGSKYTRKCHDKRNIYFNVER